MLPRDRNVGVILVLQPRHIADGCLVMFAEYFRDPTRPPLVEAKLAKGIDAEIERTAQCLPVDLVHAEPDYLVSMLAARGSRQYLQPRKFALHRLDDFERLGFVVDREDK